MDKKSKEIIQTELEVFFKYQVGFELVFDRISELTEEYNITGDDIVEIILESLKPYMKNLSRFERKIENNLIEQTKKIIEVIWGDELKTEILGAVLIYVYSNNSTGKWLKLPRILRELYYEKKKVGG